LVDPPVTICRAGELCSRGVVPVRDAPVKAPPPYSTKAVLGRILQPTGKGLFELCEKVSSERQEKEEVDCTVH
jgi:hypothetical protein